MNSEIDVRNILASIRVPSLVIHRTDDQCLKLEEGRFVADRIPGAKFVELPGNDHLPFVGDQEAILDEMEEFLTGVRHSLEPDTVLATVLFNASSAWRSMRPSWARNVGTTCCAAFIRTSGKKSSGFAVARSILVGDRPLAIFDGPARAIRCASAITEYASRLGIEMRSGLHTDECEIVDGTVAGIAAEIGACVANEANAGEVLVSRTVKDLVAGSGTSLRTEAYTSLQAVVNGGCLRYSEQHEETN